MRSVADHHVDRPEMQARQRVQSTGTNPPIGLIRSGEGGPPARPRHHARGRARRPTRSPARTGQDSAAPGKTVSSRQVTGIRRLGRAQADPAITRHRGESARHRHDPPLGRPTPAGHRMPHTASPRPNRARPGGFQGLVATARGKHPVPSRTRPLSPAAPMVLRLKTRESRSPPDLSDMPRQSPEPHPPAFSLFTAAPRLPWQSRGPRPHPIPPGRAPAEQTHD